LRKSGAYSVLAVTAMVGLYVKEPLNKFPHEPRCCPESGKKAQKRFSTVLEFSNLQEDITRRYAAGRVSVDMRHVTYYT